MSSMRRKVLDKLSFRWKEKVIPCSLKVTSFIWGFYSVLGSWLNNTRHSYYSLGWHESGAASIQNISLKILHLNTICIKSKIHSCAEGNMKLMNLVIPWRMTQMMHCAGLTRRGAFDTQWTPMKRCWNCQEEPPAWEQPCWDFCPSVQGQLSCSCSWGGVWVRPGSALFWLPLLLTKILSSWRGQFFLETGGTALLYHGKSLNALNSENSNTRLIEVVRKAWEENIYIFFNRVCDSPRSPYMLKWFTESIVMGLAWCFIDKSSLLFSGLSSTCVKLPRT